MMVQNLVTKRRHQNRTQQPGSLEYKASVSGYVLYTCSMASTNGQRRVKWETQS